MARAHEIQERLMQNTDLIVHVIASQDRVSANYVYRLFTSSHAGARHHHRNRQWQEPATTHR